MSSVVTNEIQRRFDRRIRTVINAGIQLSPEFIELQKRLEAFRRSPGTPVVSRLVKAIIDGETLDFDVLRATALAELTRDNDVRKSLDEGVREGVHARLRAIYAQDAGSNYGILADRFDERAAAFAAAAAVVDVEAPAERIIDGTPAQQKSWKIAVDSSREMTALLTPLAAAACLAGALDDTNPDALLALVVDTTEHDREKLWAAWDTEETERVKANQVEASVVNLPRFTPSRTGRWGALHRMGAATRACPLNEYLEYGRRAFNDQEFAPNNVTAVTRVSDVQLHTAAR